MPQLPCRVSAGQKVRMEGGKCLLLAAGPLVSVLLFTAMELLLCADAHPLPRLFWLS